MKTKCYSVRLESFYRISDKCYKAVSFDGREALIPASQVFGPDYDVSKSEAYWISAWILEKKDIQYSTKKEAWFYTDTGKRAPDIEVITHVPEAVATAKQEPETTLLR
jgi:hypothetical protein